MSDALRERVQAAVAAKPSKRKPKPTWEQPTPHDFANGCVIAFDQTFTHTGWAFLSVAYGIIQVIERGALHEPATEDFKGFADTLIRAERMCDRIEVVMARGWAWKQGFAPDMHLAVVHELPAVQGYRPESSLLAALGVRQAAGKRHLNAVAVANQHMRKVLCEPGSDPTSKTPIKHALVRLGLDLGRSNEHERDAIALGLTYLYDRKKAQS